MRFLKVMALAGVLVWGASSAQCVFAQAGEGPGNAPVMKQTQETQGKDIVSKRVENITRRLGLTAEQQAAVKPILEEEAAKLKELHADVKLTTAEQKTKLQELRAATNSKIRAILTPEQQKRHDELLKEASERRKARENK